MTIPRKTTLQGQTHRVKTGCGWIYVTINYNNGKPFECFTMIGKGGGCASSQAEALGRMVSLNMRSGVEIKDIHRQLTQIGCHLPCDKGAMSCADGTAQALEIEILKKEGKMKIDLIETSLENFHKCLTCGKKVKECKCLTGEEGILVVDINEYCPCKNPIPMMQAVGKDKCVRCEKEIKDVKV